MGEKDKIEKLLEDYPDVFADIINVLVYQGEEVVKPEELRTTNIRSQYKASDDVLHEEERDTLKEWNNKKGFKVLFGIENQTIKDKKMPLRVIAYDGASYRSQMLKKGAKEFCKVITLILHFGDNQWKDDKELREVINQESVNEELFQNYKLNVFDIAYLTEEQIKMFQSDFGIIADYFVKRRKGYKTIENHKPIKHVDEMLKFMRIFAEDERFLQLDSESCGIIYVFSIFSIFFSSIYKYFLFFAILCAFCITPLHDLMIIEKFFSFFLLLSCYHHA